MYQNQPNQTTTVPEETDSSPTQTQPCATSSTTASRVNTSKAPAQQACTSTSLQGPASGQTPHQDRAATKSQVKTPKNPLKPQYKLTHEPTIFQIFRQTERRLQLPTRRPDRRQRAGGRPSEIRTPYRLPKILRVP